MVTLTFRRASAFFSDATHLRSNPSQGPKVANRTGHPSQSGLATGQRSPSCAPSTQFSGLKLQKSQGGQAEAKTSLQYVMMKASCFQTAKMEDVLWCPFLDLVWGPCSHWRMVACCTNQRWSRLGDGVLLIEEIHPSPPMFRKSVAVLESHSRISRRSDDTMIALYHILLVLNGHVSITMDSRP